MAAEITVAPHGSVSINGPILAGDDKKFRSVVAENASVFAQSRAVEVLLASDGGSIRAAFEIGRIIRRSGWWTVAGGRCASACVFILAAGTSKYVFGDVVIHRPFLVTEGYEQDYATSFRHLQEEIRSYFTEMNVPVSLVDLMYSVPPRRGLTLTEGELDRYMLRGLDPVYEQKAISRRAHKLGIDELEYIQRQGMAEYICTFPRDDSKKFDFELILHENCDLAIMKGIDPEAVKSRLSYASSKRLQLKQLASHSLERCVEGMLIKGSTMAECVPDAGLTDEELFGSRAPGSGGFTDKDFILGDEEAPLKPRQADAARDWVTIFSPADPTALNAPGDTKAELMDDKGVGFVRIRSGASGSATP